LIAVVVFSSWPTALLEYFDLQYANTPNLYLQEYSPKVSTIVLLTHDVYCLYVAASK